MMLAAVLLSICRTSSQESASPPQKRYFLGNTSAPRGSASNVARCEGVILSTSMGFAAAYSASAFAFMEVSKSMTWRHPPDAHAGKMQVFPRSALMVETVAKLKD